MRTLLASILALGFMVSAATACPFHDHGTKDETVQKPVTTVGT